MFVARAAPHPENLKFPPRRFFCFLWPARFARKFQPSCATGHKILIPNKHCAVFMPVQKKMSNVARKSYVGGCLPSRKI